MMKSRSTSDLEQTLSYNFRQPALLDQALTHSSQARERESAQPGVSVRVGDNEQLEFLGDAVLGLITTEELFIRFPHFREGELSKLRAHLVSEKHLISVAQVLELGDYLRLGRGEEKSGGRNKTALLVDALEAVLGALYVDSGFEPVRRIVLQHIVAPELENLARDGRSLPLTDYKSALQEKLQAMGLPQPLYVLAKEHGPEHSKTFTVEARLPDSKLLRDAGFVGRSEGSTKKDAEQGAARQVLEHLVSLPGLPASSARGGGRASSEP